VKGEVKHCDLVATKQIGGDERSILIVELKLNFSLELVMQGINRQSLSDNVYLAILSPNTPGKRKYWRSKQSNYIKLCRKLGLGLMLVDVVEPTAIDADLSRSDREPVKLLLDPAPYAPRKSSRRQSVLLKEFNAREGDPNLGGINKTKIITAYRQNALKCAEQLHIHSTLSLKQLREKTNIENAASIMQKNHYGWFDRVEKGIYKLNTSADKPLLRYLESNLCVSDK
jgi:hypothetical protein